MNLGCVAYPLMLVAASLCSVCSGFLCANIYMYISLFIFVISYNI